MCTGRRLKNEWLPEIRRIDTISCMLGHSDILYILLEIGVFNNVKAEGVATIVVVLGTGS